MIINYFYYKIIYIEKVFSYLEVIWFVVLDKVNYVCYYKFGYVVDFFFNRIFLLKCL